MQTLLPSFAGDLLKGLKTLIVVFTLICSTQAFGQSSSLLQSPQGQATMTGEKIRLPYVVDNSSAPQFVKLDEVVIPHESAGIPLRSSSAAPMKISLEQVRNGSGTSPVSPGAWVAGNLNGSQAHYAEKWSIPYRLTLTGISTGSHTIIIEWDVMQSGKHALDYVTHYNNIDNVPGSHVSTFGHQKEVIDPTIGFSGMTAGTPFSIPTPPGGSGFGDILGDSFGALPGDSMRKMSIWNGSITSLTYGTTADLNLAAASQQLTIEFTASSSTVIIAWGGHIASIADWGTGNSASAISGSPYHTRLISFDGSGGNQDRSLSADAVIDPPTCDITGPTGSVTCNTESTFTNNSTIPSGYTYTWTLTNNTSGATIVGAGSDGSLSNQNPITVNSGSSACNKGYTVVLTIYKNGTQVGSPCTFAVTVNDATAPTIGSPGSDATIQCTATPSFTAPTASDACSQATVHLLGTTTSAGSCAGSYILTRRWDATDACGNHSATVSQVITVQDTQGPNIGGQGANATIECTATPPFSAPTASDACSGATIHLLGTTTSAGSCDGNYVLTRTWDATDGCGNHSATVSQVITVQDTRGPTIGGQGANATVECTATPPFSAPTASDACSGATVHELGTTTSAGTCAGNYILTRTWDATDGCGNHSATVSQVVTVRDTQGPNIGRPGVNATIECTATPPFSAPTASDACSGATVNLLGTTTSAGSCAGNYTLMRMWDATDACGNHSATVTQTVVVRDTQGPTIGSAGDNATIECTATPPFSAPTATDACSGATVNLLGTTTSAGTCAGKYILTRTWDAADACGNHSATVTQVITINDTQGPNIGRPGVNATIECTATPPFSAPTASDACSGATVNLLETTTSAGSCAGNYTLMRMWDATDACGNHSATVTQTVVVRDTQGPTIGSAGSNATIECTGTPPFSAPTASDACSGATVNLLGTTTVPGACAGNYTLVRTWDATDACGNHSVTRTQTVTVVDRTAPVITSCPPDAMVECSASIDPANTGTAVATDNCETPIVTYHDASSTVGCQTVITRTWTADDGCGNTTTCVQHIIQRDRTAPTIVCSNDGTGNATIHDNCSADGNITKYYKDANGSRTWTAIDESGNTATESCPLTIAPQSVLTRETASNVGSTGNSVATANNSTSTMSNSSLNLSSASGLRVSTYPNPFSDKVKFVVTTPIGGQGDLVLYNMTGQRVRTVYQGYIRSGTQIFEMSLPTGQVANFMYVLKIGDKKISGKILQVNR